MPTKRDRRDRDLQTRIEKGRASFQEKFKRLLEKDLISKSDYDVMDAIRDIRYEHAHWRPSATKRKLKYFGTPLLTSKAVKRILLDVQSIVEKLRGISGSKEMFGVIPPSFFDKVEHIGEAT